MDSIIAYSLGAVFFILLSLLIRNTIWKKRNRRIILDKINRIETAINEFEILLNSGEYINRRDWTNWINKYNNMVKEITPKYKKLKLESNIISQLDSFLSYQYNTIKYINLHNEKYSDECLIKYKEFFNTIENYPLDKSQREAIVCEEDVNLVIAGAGCGKTTTIIGKLAYLTKIRNIPKEQILMLAFTRKSANEMKERVQLKIGNEFDVSTFHSFGYKVIGEVKNDKPSIAFNGDESKRRKYIDDIFISEMNDDKYSRIVTEFFFYQFITHIKSKKEESKFVSYLGDKMKSKQEVKIANFLYLNGIKYIYEKNYEFKTSNRDYRQYQPDFYLPDYKIYIEHFGIDENGKAPKEFTDPKGYEEGIKWKRRIHKENDTILVETYSYEDSKSELVSKFEQKLKEKSVTFEKIDYVNIFENEKINNKGKRLLIEVINNFISLYKANQYTFESLKQKSNSSENEVVYTSFLKIVEPIVVKYEKYLKDNKEIDFDDMIAVATKYISENKFKAPYKFLLIDEFQDLSVGRYNLINSMVKKDPDVQLFCVGDDWQSIFRFAGSDISIFLNFVEFFGIHNNTKIETSYRFSQGIAKISNAFIMENPDQISKAIKTSKEYHSKPFEIFYKANAKDESILRQILNKIRAECKSKNSSVLILGRYNWDEPENFNSIKFEFSKYSIDIDFLTVHRAKGLEADYVVINNVIDSFAGFPAQLIDHEVLNLVLQRPETHPFAEERRLFYVAMTRAKNKFYIIGQRRKVSAFIPDLVRLSSPDIVGLVKLKVCPECFGELLERNSRYGKFWGCSNYPSCNYTIDKNKLERLNQMQSIRGRIESAGYSDMPF